jgi:hypothetical protein
VYIDGVESEPHTTQETEMKTVQDLYKLSAEVAKQTEIVNRECCRTLAGATDLMKKWNASTQNDAIRAEAKSRAIKNLGW